MICFRELFQDLATDHEIGDTQMDNIGSTSLSEADAKVSHVKIAAATQETIEKQITKHFCLFGEIQSLNVFNNKNGPGKVAYVRYYTEADAESACKGNQSIEINGRKVFVRLARKGNTNGVGGSGQSTGNNMNKKTFSGRGFKEGGITPDTGIQSDVSEHRVSHSSESDFSQMRDGNGEEDVLVTHIESPICMWAQTLTDKIVEELQTLTQKLQVICPAAPKVKGTPVTNKHYGAMFSQDGNWYRCEVKQFLSTKGKVKIFYVDFGNMEEKSAEDLVEIPQSLANFRPFSRKVFLHGLAIKNDSDYHPGIEFLQELTENKILKSKATMPLRDNLGYFGDIFVENKSISELVLEKGFAVRRNMLPPKSLPQTKTPAEKSSQRVTVNPNRNSRNEAAEYKMLLEREKAEKEMITLELITYKGKLKTAVAERSALESRIVENTLHHKIESVSSLVQRVAQLRKQFPSHEGNQDYLITSFSVALAEDRISLDSITSLRNVNKAMEDYNSTQEAIIACKTQEELAPLIELRNECRYDFHASLEIFLDETCKMPLDDRLTKVKSVIQSLEESYSAFINFIINKTPALGDAKTLYDEWKAKVLSGFQEVRGQTQAVQQTLKTTLDHIQQVISMEEVCLSSSINYDLDSLFKSYITVLQKELAVTDVEHSNDASQIASIIHEVRRVFEEELKIIDSVRRLAAEFTRQRDAIQEWLYKKPDLQDIRDVRKTLRTMKSKLRHLLADKEDLDENDSGSDEERNRIDTELFCLRSEIQKMLLTEEELMMKYSSLTEHHFPELKLANADLNLEICQMYHGILKTSREIDHYNSVRAAELPGTYHAHFNSAESVIKECAVGDRINANKEEFLQRALSYSQVSSPYLLPIEAVFLSKNQKQIYLQTQGIGVPLLDYVKQDNPKPWVVQKILRCVAEGLGALHQAGISHGNLSPQTVLVIEGKVAQLDVPDFSRPEVDPSRTWFVTEEGIEFKAPEESPTQPPPVTADLYHLGLMSLWIHLPHTELARSSDGIPDLRALPLNEDLLQVAQSMLKTPASSRVAAVEILQAEYFRNTIPELVESVTEEEVGPEEKDKLVDSQSESVSGTVSGEGGEPVTVDGGDDQTEMLISTQDLESPLTTELPKNQAENSTLDSDISATALPSNSDEESVQLASVDTSFEVPSTSDASSVPLPENPVFETSALLVDLVSHLSPEPTSTNTPSAASTDTTHGESTETLSGASLVDFTHAQPIDSSLASQDGLIGPNTLPLMDGLETLFVDSSNDLTEFTVDKNTVEALSAAGPLPSLDGSGDASGLVSTPMDNATLMQNLLKFTAQETPKNMGV